MLCRMSQHFHCTCRRRGQPQELTTLTKRQLFLDGAYTASLVPLHPFARDGMTWTDIFADGWGEVIRTVEGLSADDRKQEARFQTWARGEPLKPVPYPTTTEGVKLCHGAVLNFNERPVHLHSAIALRRWLKSRNMTYSTARRHTYLGNDVIPAHTCHHFTHIPPLQMKRLEKSTKVSSNVCRT